MMYGSIEHLKLGPAIVASEGPVLVTVPNVPICATGIEYPLSSGPATFTSEDLSDAVSCQDDPAIQSPRLGIGHIDPRYNGPQFDGTPAFGKFVNLRLAENGQVLVADIAGCPKWLADIMPVAFPNRSIEGNMEVETVTGHEWRLVIWSVKLLGVLWPGVSTLEDLPLYYGEDMPDDVEVIEPEEDDEVGASIKAARGRPGSVSANANVEDVRRAYYDSLGGDQLWWWIRGMYLDPNELIVDDDDGTLYRVPFAVDGDEITFSDPVAVKMTFVDASRNGVQERRAIALVAAAGREVASYTDRVASRPEATNEEDKTVNPVIIQSLREAHGLSETDLPDDATEEQITAAIEAATAEPGSGEEEETDDTPTGGAPEGAPEGEAQPQPVAAGAPGMITVPQAEWERTQRELQRVTARADADEATERGRVLTAAITEGKIRPADRQSYANGLENAATRDQFMTLLSATVDKGGLAPNIVPVHERGAGAQPGAAVEAGQTGGAEYDENWLSPQERQRVAAARAGTLSPDTIHVEKGA